MKTITFLNTTNSYLGFIKMVLFVLFVFFQFQFLSAQNFSKKDTADFIYYPDKIMVKANVSTQTDSYFLKSKESINLKLVPNNEYKVFFTVDYKFIGFSYGFFPKIFGGANDDNASKGKSSFSDYNFRLFLGHWLQNFNYGKVRGYYVENTADFLPDWKKGDPYIQFPNMKNESFGMSTSYVFNPKFSLRSISSFTEWQKHSAGSFIPTLSYDYLRSSFNQNDIESKEDDFNLRLGLSYFYNFILNEKFYIAPNFTPSIGVRFSKDTSTEAGEKSIDKQTYFTRFLEGGIKLGYNSDNILFGASFNFNANWYNEDSKNHIENDKIYGLVYFGYRFNAPKFIAKPVEKVEDKLKL